MKFAIVVSRFNQHISQRLLNGSLDSFRKYGFKPSAVEVFWVPGAFEIPLLALKLAKSKKFDAIVCLGCILQGETEHHHYIAQSVAQGIQYAALTSGVPITFGVLTPRTLKQALQRSEKNSANKGAQAAEAAIEMAKKLTQI